MNYIRGIVIVGLVLILFGCNNSSSKSDKLDGEIIQKADGSIFLSLKDAYLLHDKKNPKRNTAEWSFEVISKGRYEVWLSSYTTDTMNLTYEKPVIIHFGDKRLEKQPVGNEIVLDDSKVHQPYYRADSRIGSILIEDTGHYNIQVISEKVVPMTESSGNSASTIINQLILKPQTR